MVFIYNIVQIAMLLLLGPLLALVICFTPKYHGRILERLGVGLSRCNLPLGRPRVWVHALSVGEVASARSLVERLRLEVPEAIIIFSSTTRGGVTFSKKMAGLVDYYVPFPFDLFWSVRKFLKVLAPDVFILVETDFWPNFLWQLKKHNVPALLANGRITQRSYKKYYNLRFFFAPLFNTFNLISMQMEEDASRMVHLGIEPSKVVRCGNLKYDFAVCENSTKTGPDFSDLQKIVDGGCLFVAGSTHPGEEKIILESCARLIKKNPQLFLVIAPRSIERGQEILRLVHEYGFTGFLRTQKVLPGANVMVLDTLGELSELYNYADFALVGGSLVDEGGHNPIEPAARSRAVIFGPFMADFYEISQELISVGAAKVVEESSLDAILQKLVVDSEYCQSMGRLGARFVEKHQGAAIKHVEQIKRLLNGK